MTCTGEIRREAQEDAQAQIRSITQDREAWEQKYEIKRKVVKEQEQLIAQINTQKTKLEEKISALQAEHEAACQKLQEEVSDLRLQLEAATASHSYDFDSSSGCEEMVRIKGALQECERELQDC